MSDKLVTVATFLTPIEAELARCHLEEVGIRAFLADGQTVGMVWTLGNALGGIKLQVIEHDAQKALDTLSEADASCEPDAAYDKEETARSSDDEPEEPAHTLTRREENADRAFRGAIIGLLLMPIQFYVLWLLIKVFVSDEELRPAQRRAALWAAAINIPLVIIFGLYLRSL